MRSIVFDNSVIKNTLEGRKTQYRCVGKDQDHRPVDEDEDGWYWQKPVQEEGIIFNSRVHVACPYGVVSDQLWVKEVWQPAMSGSGYWYGADNPYYDPGGRCAPKGYVLAWKSASRMPRKVSRITLQITKVRVERLHDASTDDMLAELGWSKHSGTTIAEFDYEGRMFREFWNRTNKKCAWDTNPWVWVIDFVKDGQMITKYIKCDHCGWDHKEEGFFCHLFGKIHLCSDCVPLAVDKLRGWPKYTSFACSECNGRGKMQVCDEAATEAQACCGENRTQYMTVSCQICKGTGYKENKDV